MNKAARQIKTRLGRRCSVCSHPERGRIDYLLCTLHGAHGHGRRALAEKFGLGADAIYRHGRAHISSEYRTAARVGPFESEEQLRKLVAESGASALDRFNGLFNGHLARWLNALEIGDDQSMVAHGKVMGQLLAKVGQITRELTPSGAHTLIQQNFVTSPDYYNFLQRALTVLRRHPTALQDWLAEFRQQPADTKLIEASPDA
jgi:hypothetical protein